MLCLPLKCLFFLRFHKPLIVSFKLIIITKSRSIRVLHHSFINTNHNSFPHALMNYQISHQYTCSNNQTLQLSKLRRINFGDVISTCLRDCSRHKLQRGRLLYSGWDLPSQAKRDTFSPVTTSHQFRKRSYFFHLRPYRPNLGCRLHLKDDGFISWNGLNPVYFWQNKLLVVRGKMAKLV